MTESNDDWALIERIGGALYGKPALDASRPAELATGWKSELARGLGVTPGYLNHVRTGVRKLSPEVRSRLEMLLDEQRLWHLHMGQLLAELAVEVFGPGES